MPGAGSPDFSAMPVARLRYLIKRAGLSDRDCIEKRELVQTARKAWGLLPHHRSRTRLHDAAEKNDAAELDRLLIVSSARAAIRDADGKLPAHLTSSAECLNVLGASGGNSLTSLSIRDSAGKTPAHYAAERNDAEALKVLAKFGANLALRDASGKVPAHLTSSAECLGVIGASGGIGRESLSCKDSQERLPAHHAAARNDADALKVLAKLGADLSPRDAAGKAPAHLTSSAECLRVIGTSGATANRKSLSSKDNRKRLPAHYAAGRNDVLALKVLAKLGANLALRDTSGLAPAHLTSSAECLRVIGTSGPSDLKSLSYKDNSRRETPAHRLACRGDFAALQVLGELGAKISEKDSSGRTPLHRAVQRGWRAHRVLAVVQTLVGLGADPTVQDSHRRIVAEVASRTGGLEAVRQWLESTRDHSQLRVAIECGLPHRTIRALLQRGRMTVTGAGGVCYPELMAAAARRGDDTLRFTKQIVPLEWAPHQGWHLLFPPEVRTAVAAMVLCCQRGPDWGTHDGQLPRLPAELCQLITNFYLTRD